jgi:hypothetical protein
MANFLIDISPDFLKGSDATNHTCEGCGLRPACHVHHKEFKKLGGAGERMKKWIERPENKIELCLICHEATHGIRAVMADGFCCDVCPQLKICRHGARTLQRPYDHLTPRW